LFTYIDSKASLTLKDTFHTQLSCRPIQWSNTNKGSCNIQTGPGSLVYNTVPHPKLRPDHSAALPLGPSQPTCQDLYYGPLRHRGVGKVSGIVILKLFQITGSRTLVK